MKKIIVDLTKEPVFDEHTIVMENEHYGKVPYEKIKVTLCNVDKQEKIQSCMLHVADLSQKQLKVANTALLDFYMKHPDLIPASLIGKKIFFPRTEHYIFTTVNRVYGMWCTKGRKVRLLNNWHSTLLPAKSYIALIAA